MLSANTIFRRLFALIILFVLAVPNLPAQKQLAGVEDVYFSKRSPIPAWIKFRDGQNISPEDFPSWLQENFPQSPEIRLKKTSNAQDPTGESHWFFQQVLNGVPVEGAEFRVHGQKGSINSANGDLFPGIQLSTRPGISAENAFQTATSEFPGASFIWEDELEEKILQERLNDPNASWKTAPDLVIANDGKRFRPQDFRLCWKVDVYVKAPMQRFWVYVDAGTGEIFQKISRLHHVDVQGTAETRYSGTQTITVDSVAPNSYRLREYGRGNGIETLDLQQTPNFWAATDFTDTDNYWNNVNPAQDEAATDAHWGAEMTYDYYLYTHGRNSIDDNGYLLQNFVHYQTNFNDGYWDGSRMVYGDGDGVTYTPLTDLDVVGHEITHGLTAYTSNLDTRFEPGSLNESFSDLMAVAIDRYARPGSWNWQIAEKIRVNGTALRDLQNPNITNNPDTYQGTNWDASLNLIHNNSTVCSHAAYLMANGGSGTNDNGDNFSVSGIGPQKTFLIIYRAFTLYLTTFSDYADARQYIIRSAEDLYGACSQEAIAATNAWYAVGLGFPFFNGVTADFVPQQTEFCSAPATISLRNTSTNANSFFWDFGDGNTSTDRDPLHTYLNPGSYTITLIANGGSCGSDTLVSNNVIQIDPMFPCVVNMNPNNNNDLQTACNGTLYDDGGATGQYDNNIQSEITIAPYGALSVDLSFSQFDFRTNDTLFIYDGPNSGSPLLGAFTGTSLPNGGAVSSSGPEITLVQSTNNFAISEGFALTWSCVYGPFPPVADFSASPTTNCTGVVNFTDQSSGNPANWLWDFGDGNTSTLPNPVHTYSSNGTYTVKLVVSNVNGADSLLRSSYITINQPASPTTTSAQRCDPGQVTLQATGSGQQYWFDQARGGTLVGIGTSYTTPVLSSTTTYYVESQVPASSQFVGPLNDGIGSSGFLNSMDVDYLSFDAHTDLVIKSVWINANTPGNKIIVLQDDQGNNLQFSAQYVATAGPTRVNLNFNVPAGTNYRLGGRYMDCSFNTTGVSFPYSIPGTISITGSSQPGSYFFYYDWEIEGDDCISPRVPVTATIGGGTSSVSVTPTGPVNLCDGETIALTASTGNSYLWSTGDTTQSIDVSASGSYSVSVSNPGGCSGTSDTVLVTVHPRPGIVLSPADTSNTCPGDSTLLSASGASNWQWSHGPTTASVQVPVGNYFVIGQNAQGCADTSTTVSVGEFPFTAAISGPSTVCSGGVALLSASPGTDFLWSVGDTTSTLSVTTPGTYSVTLTDTNGCRQTSPLHILGIGAGPTAGIFPAGPQNICTGESLTFYASGGASYLWSDGSTADSLVVSSGGNYYVIATDTGGCVDTSATVLVIEHQPTANVQILSGDSTFCPGDSVVLLASNGSNLNWSTGETTQSISITQSGTFSVTLVDSNGCEATSPSVNLLKLTPPTANITPAGPWTICPGDSQQVSAGGGVSAIWSHGPAQLTIDLTNSGNYSVIVTDTNGCRDTSATYSLSFHTPSAQISGDTVACAGDSVFLFASSGSQFLWSNGDTGNQTLVPPGTYSLTLTDQNGCAANSSPFTVNTAPNPVATISGDTAFCPGDLAVLNAGGGISYTWNGGQSGSSFTTGTPGSYFVVAANSFGCLDTSATWQVTEFSPAATISVLGDTLLCQGDSVQLFANSGSNYSWSTGATTQSIWVSAVGSYSVAMNDSNGCFAVSDPVNISTASNIVANISPAGNIDICPGNLEIFTASGGSSYAWSNGMTGATVAITDTGSYYVVATTPSGCRDTSDIMHLGYYQPFASISGDTSACNGDSTLLVASTGTNFAWSTGDTTQFLWAGPGLYFVSLEDSNGCFANSPQFEVSAAGGPTASITPSADQFICPSGGSVMLSAGGGVNYLWSNSSSQNSINASSPGGYFVVAIDSNGCRDTSQTVNIGYHTPTASITPSGPVSICQGDSVELFASTGSNFLWSTGESGPSIFANSTGTYSVSLIDSNGCFATSASVVVNVSNNIQTNITPSGNPNFCPGDSLQLTASGANSYLWSTGQTGSSIFVSSPGSYYVIGTSGNGCQDTSDVVNPSLFSPTASISGDTLVCAGSTTEIEANLGSSWLWNTGDTTRRLQVGPGTYSVSVMDINGCEAQSLNFTVSDFPGVVSATISPVSGQICPEDSLLLTASGGANYLWSNGATGATLSAPPGTYSVIATDTNGCRDTSAQTTIQSFLPQASISGSSNLCFGDTIVLQSSAGSNFSWSNGETLVDSILVTNTGDFTVSLVDGNGCAAVSDTFSVTAYPSANAQITPAGPLSICLGDSVELTASGGSSFTWSNGETGNSVFVSGAGSYFVIASSAGACADTSFAVGITVNQGNATISGDTAICPGDQTLLSAGNGSQFLWSNGATSQIVSVGAGDYSVAYVDASGCRDTSALFSVREVPGATDIEIFPSDTVQTCLGDSVLLFLSESGVYDNRVTAPRDDAREKSGGSMNLNHNDLKTGKDGWVGVTFKNITIPANAVISSAYLTFTSEGNFTATPSSVTIWAEDRKTPAPFSTAQNDITSRSRTSGNVAWNLGTWEEDSLYQSTDISALVTELLSNHGGYGGGKMAFLLEATGTKERRAYSRDASTANAPRLHIEWAIPTGIGYAWNTGVVSDSLWVDSTGNYFVVTGAGACQDTSEQVYVEFTENLAFQITGDTSGCVGAALNFASDSIFGGGTTYSWDFGDGQNSVLTNPTHSFTASGQYWVVLTATEPGGCISRDSQQVDIFAPAGLAPNLGADTSFCQGDSILLDPGVMAQSWNWHTGATTQSLWVNQDGWASVTVSDANGCTATDSVLLSFYTPPTPSLGNDTVLCAGDTLNLSPGIFSAYQWSTGENSSQIQTTAEALIWVEVSDLNGCLARDSILVDTSVVTASISPSGLVNLCPGSFVDMTLSGGVVYEWYNGQTTQTIDSLQAPGIFWGLAENIHGCQDTAWFEINILNPSTSISLSDDTLLCEGESLTLTSSFGQNYAWSNGAGSRAITVDTAGSFAVTVTDPDGCVVNSDTIFVEMAPPVNIVLTPGGNNPICPGDSVTFTASGGLSYVWQDGSTGNSLVADSTGTFQVTGISAEGCSDTSSVARVSLLDNSSSLTLVGDSVLCSGDSATLQAGPGSNYLWSTGDTTSSLVVYAAGTYSVQYQSPDGCLTDSKSLQIYDAPVINLVILGGNDICPGDSISLRASGAASYLWSTGETSDSIQVGAGSYFVIGTTLNGCSDTSAVETVNQWTPFASPSFAGNSSICPGASTLLAAGPGTNPVWSTGSTDSLLSVSSAGAYSVTVTDSNGCQATSAPLILTADSLPTISINPSGPLSICQDDSVEVFANGGVLQIWENGDTNSTKITAPGFHTVQVWGSNGCAAIDSIEINQNHPTARISGPHFFCPGDTVLLQTNSGNGHQWSNGSNSPSVQVTTPGTFVVNLVDSNGCAATSAPFTLAHHSLPTPQILASGPTEFCPGGQVTLFADGGDYYEWSTGDTVDSLVVSTQMPVYLVAFDSSGCTDTTSSLQVNVFTPFARIYGDQFMCPGDSVLLTANSGSNYSWSTGANSQGIWVNTPGNYQVSLLDSNGCSAGPDSIDINFNAPPTALVSPSDTVQICPGSSATLTASGGNSVLWSNGNTGNTLQTSVPGSYFAIVQDSSGGCTDTSNVVVVEEINLTTTISASGPSRLCPGDSVLLSASSGASFVWSTGDTTQSIVAQSTGIYSVQVTDSNGCFGFADYFVDQGIVPNAQVMPAGTTQTCPGQGAIFTASGGNSYQWSNGQTTSSMFEFFPGDYFAVATSVDGCRDTSNVVTLTEYLPRAQITPTGPLSICPGDSIVLTSSPGNSYLWSSGANTQSIVVKNAGVFTVSQVDTNGCFATSNAVQVSTLNPPIAQISPSGNAGFCPGGSVTLTAGGGQNYLWSSGDTTNSISVNSAGSFSVIVSDSNGCRDTSAVVNTLQHHPNSSIQISGDTMLCPGDSVTFTASTGNSFLWSTGEMTQSIRVGQPGSYQVLVVDGNGCNSVAGPVSVTNVPQPVAQISPAGTTSVCPGDTAFFVASGGISFNWSTGAGGSSLATSNPGNYSVVVTDSNGCRDTSAVSTLIQNTPVATITVNGSNQICPGDSVLLTTSAGSNFLWSTGETTQSIRVATGGAYSVTLNDANGCRKTSNPVFITVRQQPNAGIFPAGSSQICPDDSLTFSSSGGVSYLWSDGSMGNTLTTRHPGNYFVVVTDAFGCFDTSSVAVLDTFVPQANVSPAGPLAICREGSVTLTAGSGNNFIWNTGATGPTLVVSDSGSYSVTLQDVNGCLATSGPVQVAVLPAPVAGIVPSGADTICPADSLLLTGSGGSSFLWSNGSTGSSIFASASGGYEVIVTDGNGCKDTSSVFQLRHFVPVATISASGSPQLCPGDSVSLMAGNGSQFLWSTGDTVNAITVSSTGTYSVTLTDSNGCRSTSSPVNVSSLAAPVVSLTPSGQDTVCPGDTILLTASGGTTYVWNTGDNGSQLAVSDSGSYFVTATDVNGCSSTSSTFDLHNFIPQAQITPVGPLSLCPADSIQLDASAGSQFQWSTGSQNASIMVADSGSYSLSLIDGNGCFATDTIQINQYPEPVASIIPSGPLTFCPGDSVVLSASPGVSFDWNSGEISSSIVVTTARNSFVTLTDSNGCQATSQVLSTALFQPTATVSPAGPVVICPGDTVSLSASSGSGFSWNNGATSRSISVDTAGSYFVSLTDSNGCQATSAPVNVSLSTPPVATISPSGLVEICPNGQVSLTAGGGNSYAWSTGATTNTLTVGTPSNFFVVALNADGCRDTSSVVQVRFRNPVVTISPGGSPSLCDGDSLLLTAGPGSSFAWTTGDTTQSILVSSGGSYGVTYTDTLGCRGASNPANVLILPAPQATISPNDTFYLCPGDSVRLRAGTGTDYLWSSGDTISAFFVDTAGTFQVAYTHPNGCVAPLSEPTRVEISPVPPATISPAGPLHLCQQDSVWLHASPALTNFWSTGVFGDSVLINEPGNFYFVSTNLYGCSDTSSVTAVTQSFWEATIDSSGPLSFCDGDSVGLSANPGGMAYLWNTGDSSQQVNSFASGYYEVVVTDSFGCQDTSGTVLVTVWAVPVANFAVSHNNQSLTFTDLSTGSPTQWHWDFGDGDSSNLQNPVHTYDTSGTFVVTLIVSNGNCRDTISIPVDVNFVGIDPGMEEIGFDLQGIWPNPFSSELNFALGLPESGWLEIELVNVLGQDVQAVFAGDVPAGDFKYRWEAPVEMSEGIYFVRLRWQGQTLQRKLIYSRD